MGSFVLRRGREETGRGPHHTGRYRRRQRYGHNAEVQADELLKSGQQRPDAEKLRTSVQPRVVMNADFDDTGPAEFQFSHEFHTDGSAGGGKLQVLEQVLRSSGEGALDLRRDVARRIARKIDYTLAEPGFDSTKFLEAFYAAQRRRLESELAFGRRRRDKNDRSAP